MKEYGNDLKIVLFVLAVVAGSIIWNKEYFFSQQTMDEVKIVDTTKQIGKKDE
ncbi:MAG: hypothetical protein U9Q33_13160 [Campylobacterota bacterium]|nr:hypothetical protein [Campylobacterota bacterium]